MAKRKPRRKMGRYIRGAVDVTSNLTTLGAKAVSAQVFPDTVNERTLVTSIVARYALSEMTPIADSGPIMVGIAHNDYTAAEIEEWIENLGSWDEGDLVGQEIGKRKIRMVGTFGEMSTVIAGAEVLNDGKPIKTKLNWILNQGQTLDLWAYNAGTVAVATTVPNLTCLGHVNLFPK